MQSVIDHDRHPGARMLHRHAICLVLTATLLAGCDSAPTEPNAAAGIDASMSNAVVEHRRERQVQDLLINDCTGETFATTINLHELFAITETSSGAFQLKFHINIDAVATDPATGQRFRGVQVLNEHLSLARGEAYTFKFKFVMTGQGEGKLVDVVSAVHVTLNPDGTVTSSFDRFTLSGHDCDA